MYSLSSFTQLTTSASAQSIAEISGMDVVATANLRSNEATVDVCLERCLWV